MILNNIPISDIMTNLVELCEETRPHIIKRKIKVKKKYKYKKILVINPFHDIFILETFFSLKMSRILLNEITNEKNCAI